MIAPAPYFPAAAACYTVALAAAPAGPKLRPLAWTCLVIGLAANAVAVSLRYYQAWPMLPMYLGAQALPLVLGTILLAGATGLRPPFVPALALVWLTAGLAALFPKDYYLPFVKSASWLAHFFFAWNVLGRACFLASAAWAATALGKRQAPTRSPGRAFWWAAAGFGCWTISMFCGELWSYRGWGVPVVWDDPAITTTMATWFFYICLLHLHLTGTWSLRLRTAFAAAGAMVVLLFNCLPDLGPLRIPF